MDYAKRDKDGKIIKRFDRETYSRKFEEAKRRHTGMPQPDDLVLYPDLAMKISRQGKDKGPVVRDMDDAVMVDDDGRKFKTSVVKDGLSRMFDNGSINKDQLEAAREFQKYFRLAGYDRIKTTSLTGISGGGMTIEDQMTRTIHARKYCQQVMDILGGSKCPMWKAVFWCVGHGYGLNRFAKKEVENGTFWSGVLRSALYLMAIEYRHSQRKQKRGLAGYISQ